MRLGTFIVQLALFEMVLIPLLASSVVFAGDTPASGSSPGDSPGKFSRSDTLRPAKNIKRVSKKQPDAHSEMRSLVLPFTAPGASEHSADLPISPTPRSAPPSGNSWTGFYVGAGGGIAQP
jgi:hypothetical protein